MSIPDVDKPGSDGWWMHRGWDELRLQRHGLTRLENYRRGTPPMNCAVTPDVQAAWYRAMQMARLNVADLVVKALVERLEVRTIRTAADHDDDGDAVATRMWQASGMKLGHADLKRMLATFGRALTSISAPDQDEQWPRIAPEDPRECVVVRDVCGRRVAGFKLFHEPLGRVDYAILWRPGRKIVAVRENASRPVTCGKDRALREPRLSFSPTAFTVRTLEPEDWEPSGDPTKDLLWSEEYAEQTIPIVEHVAPDGVGVFELHTDVLDEINDIRFQALATAKLQAFRQRAMELAEELPKTDPETGIEIDYNDVFAAHPGALWKLPIGAKIWESGQADMNGIRSLGKDRLQDVAAVTRTPFSMFSSDSVNQSAEGAQLTREGLVFKAEDFQRIEDDGLIESLSIGFRFAPDDVRYADVDGVRVDRADPAGMAIGWLPAERYSLAERTLADSQSSLPRRQKWARFYNMTPAEVDLAMSQAAEDVLLAPPSPPTRTRTGDVVPAGG